MNKCLIYYVGALSLFGCVTTQEAEKPSGPVHKVSYKIRSVKNVQNVAPLPNQSSIFVDWQMSDGTVVSAEGFRAWDVNHDGRFEMLEILTTDGQTKAWAMDFNGDGKVDSLKAAMAEQTAAIIEAETYAVDEQEADKLLQLSH